MSTSRSTPRLRLTVALLAGLLALVAVSERTGATGLAGEMLQLLGLAFAACAALGRVWTSVFIAGYKDARLVRHGPYAVLRHPLYALSMLAMLGLGLATRSASITVVLVVVAAALHALAARSEDAWLRDAHGTAHADYARDVRALLPRWSRYEVPDSLEVRPRLLWKAFLDAGSLIGFWMLLALADALQAVGVTPTWLQLP